MRLAKSPGLGEIENYGIIVLLNWLSLKSEIKNIKRQTKRRKKNNLSNICCTRLLNLKLFQ